MLECMLQHHTKCTKGRGKAPRNAQNDNTSAYSWAPTKATSTQTQMDSISHECMKTTRLLLGAGKYIESRRQNKGRARQENGHALLGAEKINEYGKQGAR